MHQQAKIFSSFHFLSVNSFAMSYAKKIKRDPDQISEETSLQRVQDNIEEGHRYKTTVFFMFFCGLCVCYFDFIFS